MLHVTSTSTLKEKEKEDYKKQTQKGSELLAKSYESYSKLHSLTETSFC